MLKTDIQEADLINREIAMYGATRTEVIKSFENTFMSKGLYIMGILSDMQEANAHEQYELARKLANRAKLLLGEYLPKDEDGRML